MNLVRFDCKAAGKLSGREEKDVKGVNESSDTVIECVTRYAPGSTERGDKAAANSVARCCFLLVAKVSGEGSSLPLMRFLFRTLAVLDEPGSFPESPLSASSAGWDVFYGGA